MKQYSRTLGTTFAAMTTAVLTACSAIHQPQTKVDDTGLQQQVAASVHVCSSCHGQDGNSISPAFPKLAGQRKNYLVSQLVAFRNKTRADPDARTYMWGMAAHLTDAQIDHLTDYFGSQIMSPGIDRDPADTEAGKKLFANGDPNRGVPACRACHGANGEGNGPFPKLAGQHKDYLAKQLENFATNVRANAIMHNNAKPLTLDQVRQLATYLAAIDLAGLPSGQQTATLNRQQN